MDLRNTIEFFENSIGFRDYDFFPSTVYTRTSMKKIMAGEIDEIDLDAAPPTLKIDNELVFISAEFRSDLESFAKRNGIEVKSRFDIWDAILEPFIDTEFTAENAERNQENLMKYGLGKDQVAEWRDRVRESMIAYNFGTGLWDWVHLGLWDLLSAYKHGMGERLTKDEYTQLYWSSMKIALLSYV
jgi:hypothetical protein